MKILQVSNQSFKGAPVNGHNYDDYPDRYATVKEMVKEMHQSRDYIINRNTELLEEQNRRLAAVLNALLPIIPTNAQHYQTRIYDSAVQDLAKPFALDVQA